MRTKLFLTFLFVITIALVSNLIFQNLILKDFTDYTRGVETDRLYLVLGSVEGSYADEGWDFHQLTHAMQWGAMLGYDMVLLDPDGKHIDTSIMAIQKATPTLRRRIEAMVHIDNPVGDYEEFPLFSENREIGFLMARPLEARVELGAKESMFRQRINDFLLISFFIAGGGAVLLAILMSLYLTRPLRRLKDAAELVAGGDLGVRVAPGPEDEVGKVIVSFNRMLESLEREETLRRHLTSNIAHELRTPITVLRSNLEAVSDGVVPCEPETIRSLESEVERLTNLIKGIEDFTKAEAFLLSPTEYEEVRLSEFVSSVTASMHKVFEDSGAELSIACSTESTFETDSGKLETVLRNILANAASHARDASTVVSCGVTDRGFYVEVTDSGPGIPKENLENVFKRFYKGKGSEGTGLGLSIAKELVEAMGGSISVSSPEGGGASFRVELPGEAGG